MDECWEAGQRLLRRERGICLDCHDECIAKPSARSRRSAASAKRSAKSVDPRLLFSPRYG